jgi:DNA-binding response OmpR family regulator
MVANRGADSGGLTVLLADDEAGIRHLVGPVLRDRGFTVLEAADGADALAIADRDTGPIHLLLTDWCMPGLNGSELISRLGSRHPAMAVLVMSGDTDLEDGARGPILRKPFHLQELVSAVNQALEFGSNAA